MATDKKVSLSKLNRSNTFDKIFDCIDNNFTKLANVINSGSLNNSIEIEEFVANEYQTNFTLRDTFIPGTNALVVYVNNARQWEGTGFEEVGNQAFTLSTPADLGTLVKAVYIRTDPEFIKIENVYDDEDITDSSSQSSSSGATGVQIAATDLAKVNEAILQIQSMMIEVQSYVHGGTGSRRGESTDNATYLFNECQRMVREIRTLRDELKTTGYTVDDNGDVLLSELSANMIAYGQSTVDDTLKGFELTLSTLQSLINTVDSSRVKYKNTTVELKLDSIMALLTDFNNRLETTTVPADIEEQINRLQNSITTLSRAVSGTINASSVIYDDTGLTILDELATIERNIRSLDLKINRENGDIGDDVNSLRSSINRLSDLLTSDELALDRLTKTVNGIISDIDSLKNSEDGNSISSDNISVGRITLTEKLSQLSTLVSNIENSLSSTNTNLASINRKVNDVSDNYELMESNMNSLDRRVTKQLNSMIGEIDEISESVNTLDRQTTRNFSNINTELQEVTANSNVLNQKLSSLTDRLDNIEVSTGISSSNNLTSGNIKLEDNPEKTVTSKFSDIDRNLDILNTNAELLSAKVNNVSNKLNDLIEEDKDISSDISSLDRKITTNCRNMLDDISEVRSSFSVLENNTASQIRAMNSGLEDSVSLLDNFKRTTRSELNDIYERLESINQSSIQSGEDIIITGKLTATDIKSGDTNVQVVLDELESKRDLTDKKLKKLSDDLTDELESIKVTTTDLNSRLKQTNTNLGNLSDSVNKNSEDIGKVNRYVDRLVNEIRNESETFNSNVMKDISSIENRLTNINSNLDVLNNATLASGSLDSVTVANLTASNISYGINSNVKIKLDNLTNDLEYLNSRTSTKINEIKLNVESLDDKTKRLESKLEELTTSGSLELLTRDDLTANNIEFDSNFNLKEKINDLMNNQEYLDLKYSTKTDTLQKNINNLDTDIKQINKDLNSITGQLVDINDNFSSLDLKYTRMSTSINNLSSDFLETTSNIELANRELNRKLTILTNDLDLLDTDTKKDLKELKNRLDNLSNSINNISSGYSNPESSQVTVVSANAYDIKYEESNVKVKLDELTEELNDLDLQTTKSINLVKSDLSELTDVVNSNNNKANRNLTSIQTGMEDIENSIASLNSKTTKALSKLQIDLESITDDINYLATKTNKSITNVQNDLELLEVSVENSIRNLSNRIDNIGISIDTISAGIDTLSGNPTLPESLRASDIIYDSSQNVKQKIESLTEDIESVDNKYSKSITKIQNNLSNNEDEIDELISRVNSNNSRLQSNINSLEDDFSNFSINTNRELNNIKITNENLRIDLDKNIRDIKDLKDSLTNTSQGSGSNSGLETLTPDSTWSTIISDSEGSSTSVPLGAIHAEDVLYRNTNVKDKLDGIDEDIDVLNTNLTKKERTLQLNIENLEDSINSVSSRTTKQINQLSDRVEYCESISNNLTQKVNRKITEFTDTLNEASDKIEEFDSKVTGLVTRDSIDSAKVIFEESSNVHDQLVEILGLLRQLTSSGQDSISSNSLLDLVLPNNAGSHNGIFRGNNLGTEITDEQSNAIKKGTFEDIFIGDYWTFRGKKYYVAGLDLFLNTGPDSEEDIYSEVNQNELESDIDNSFLTSFDNNPSITSTNDNYKLKDHHLVLIPEEILDLNKAMSVTDTLAASQDSIPAIITIPSGEDTLTVPSGEDTIPSSQDDNKDIYEVPYEYVLKDSEGNDILGNIIIIGTNEKAIEESLSLSEASLTAKAIEATESKEKLISFLENKEILSYVEQELSNRNSDIDNISTVTVFNIHPTDEIQNLVNEGNSVSVIFDIPELKEEDSVLVLINNSINNSWEIVSSSVIEDGKLLIEFNHFCLVMIFKVNIVNHQGDDTVTTPSGEDTITTPGGDDTVTIEPDTTPSSIITLPNGENPTIIGEGTLESLFGGLDITEISSGNSTINVINVINVIDSITGETIKSEIVIVEPAILAYSDFDNGVFNGMFYNGSPNGIIVKPPVLITLTSGDSDSLNESLSVNSGNATVMYGEDILKEEPLPVSIQNSSEFDGGVYNSLVFNNLKKYSININMEDFNKPSNVENIGNEGEIPDVSINIPESKQTDESEFNKGYYNVIVFNGSKSIQITTEDISMTEEDSYVSIPDISIEIPKFDLEDKDNSLSEFDKGYYNITKFNGENVKLEVTGATDSSLEEYIEIPNTVIEIPSINSNTTINSGLDYGYYNQALFNGKGTSTVKPEVITDLPENNYEDYIEIPKTEISIPSSEIEENILNDSRFNNGFYNVAHFNKYIEDSIQVSEELETTPSGFESQSGGLETLESGEIEVTVPVAIDKRVISEFDKGIYNGLLFNGTGKGSEQLSQITIKPIDSITGVEEYSTITNNEEISIPDIIIDIPVIETDSIANSEWNKGILNLMLYEGNKFTDNDSILPDISIKPEESIISSGDYESITTPSGQIITIKPVTPVLEESSILPDVNISIISEDSINSEFNSGYYNVMMFDGKDKAMITLSSDEGIIQGGQVTIETVLSDKDSILTEYIIYNSEFDSGFYNVMSYNSHTSIGAEGIVEPEIAQNIPILIDGSSDSSSLNDGEIPVTRIKIPTLEAGASIDSRFNFDYYNVTRFNRTSLVPQIDKYSTISSEEKEGIQGETVIIPDTPIIVPTNVIYSEFNYGKHNKLVMDGDKYYEIEFDDNLVFAEGDNTPSSGQDTVTIPSGEDTINPGENEDDTLDINPTVEPIDTIIPSEEDSVTIDTTSIFEFESGEFELSIYNGKSALSDFLTQFAISDNLTFNGHRKSWYTRRTFEDIQGNLYSKWIEVDYRLLTEISVFGARIHGKAERTEITSQFPIFKLSPEFIRIGQDYWLSDMVSKSNNICMVTKEGESFYADAEEIKGIRPFFVIG